MAPTDVRRTRLFVYGTLLPGEPDHALLAGAEALGPARTAQGFALVELPTLAGLVAEGAGVVVGEVFVLDPQILRGCDVKREIGRLFQRRRIALADGTEADTYLLEPDQVRGKRRVKDGDWRARFAAKKPGDRAEAGPFVRWARGRYDR